MGIICGPQVVAINTSSNTAACGHQIKIDDIRLGYSTINVLIDNSLIVPQVGIAAIVLGGNILTIKLLSKNDGSGTASINFTVSTDPCVGITCSGNVCVGTDLYNQRCSVIYDGNLIPIDYECVPYQLIDDNSPSCVGMGQLSFNSDPWGARIFLAPYGQTPTDTGQSTPYTTQNLVSGPYSYILKRFNYQDYIGTINVMAGQTIDITSLMTPLPDAVQQFRIKLKSETTATFVIDTLNRFTDFLNAMILAKFTGVMLNNVIYDQTNHEVVFEIENIPTLQQLTYDQQYYQYQLQNGYYDIKTLPIFIVLVPLLIEILFFISAFILGWMVASLFGGPKEVTPTHSRLQITVKMLTNGAQALPAKDVTVEIAGQTLLANTANGYIVTSPDLEIGKTYPIKAYIPISPDSKVMEAAFEGTKAIQNLTMNFITVSLKIDTLQQKDWQLCSMKLDENPMPSGTKLLVYRIKTLEDGNTIADTLGLTTIQTNPDPAKGQCTGIVKVPAYLPDKQVKYQVIPDNVTEGDPSPRLRDGDDPNATTYGKDKNMITVITEDTLKENTVVDKIEIKDKSTGSVIKSVTPSIYTTLVSEIPRGTYIVSVTKSGYDISGCSIANCEVNFDSDIMGSTTVTVVLQSIVKTCKLDITVLDIFNKAPKTETYITIDNGTETLAPGGILSIKSITVGDHKFTVRADGYKTIDKVTKAIKCGTIVEALPFTLEQITDIVTGSLELTVGDQKGSIHVEKGESLIVKVTNAIATEQISIYNISELPDLLIATIPAGMTETTLSFSEDTAFELQAFQGCICTPLGCIGCTKYSNIISLAVGKGGKGCLVPGPFGTCIVSEGLGQGILLVGGLIVGGIIIFKSGILTPKPVSKPTE